MAIQRINCQEGIAYYEDNPPEGCEYCGVIINHEGDITRLLLKDISPEEIEECRKYGDLFVPYPLVDDETGTSHAFKDGSYIYVDDFDTHMDMEKEKMTVADFLSAWLKFQPPLRTSFREKMMEAARLLEEKTKNRSINSAQLITMEEDTVENASDRDATALKKDILNTAIDLLKGPPQPPFDNFPLTLRDALIEWYAAKLKTPGEEGRAK